MRLLRIREVLEKLSDEFQATSAQKVAVIGYLVCYRYTLAALSLALVSHPFVKQPTWGDGVLIAGVAPVIAVGGFSVLAESVGAVQQMVLRQGDVVFSLRMASLIGLKFAFLPERVTGATKRGSGQRD